MQRTFRFILLLIAAAAGKPGSSTAQTVHTYDPSKYILVDPAGFRGLAGFSQVTMHHLNDPLPDRTAQVLDLRIEGRLISSFIKEDHKFVLYDAFYLDLALGKMSSEPFTSTSFGKTDKESWFSMMAGMGYDLLGGYRNETFGVLGGKRFEWLAARVGGTAMPSSFGNDLFLYTSPWVLKGEYHIAPYSNECRIMVTAWSNFREDGGSSGLRLDIPVARAKRFWLSGQYQTFRSTVSTYLSNYPNSLIPATLSQFTVGLRFGSIY